MPGGGVTTVEVNAAIAGLAPGNATYIVKTANGTLTNEVALDALPGAPGVLAVADDGTLSIAVGADLPAHTTTVTTSLGYSIGDGVSVINTGNKFGFRVGFAGTLTAKYMVSDVSTITVVDVWASTAYPPTNANSITGGNELTISASTAEVDNAEVDNAMTGWTAAFAANTWFFFNVDSNNNAKWLGISIDFTRAL
jgi:hypothetical protein